MKLTDILKIYTAYKRAEDTLKNVPVGQSKHIYDILKTKLGSMRFEVSIYVKRTQ